MKTWEINPVVTALGTGGAAGQLIQPKVTAMLFRRATQGCTVEKVFWRWQQAAAGYQIFWEPSNVQETSFKVRVITDPSTLSRTHHHRNADKSIYLRWFL